MGINQMPSVRKATTPPLSVIENGCPVAVLAQEAAALVKARRRLVNAKQKAKENVEQLEGKNDVARSTAARRLGHIEEMQDAIEDRLDAIQKNASQLRAQSPEGAQYQLSQLFNIAQTFSCGEEFYGDKGSEYITRLHGLGMSLRAWFQTNYPLAHNAAESIEYAGINDPHKALAAALKFDGGEIPDDDAD